MTACAALWKYGSRSLVAALFLPAGALAQQSAYVVPTSASGSFPLAVAGRVAPLLVDPADDPAVRRAARDLAADLGRVTGVTAAVQDTVGPGGDVVIIGTVGKSALLDRLVRARKLDVSAVQGRWETFQLQVVERPLPGVARALVIAGSDRRGTIYGIYDLSAEIGVTPWYWWADVPVRRRTELYVLPGIHSKGEPRVRYRGFFINDEAPALSGWAHEKFGGFNSKFYAHVFELLLRLKGNYLWPAMWGNAFYDDDVLNRDFAQTYGVVIGTSHHEPMLRAHDEWRRYGGGGAWHYEKNAPALRAFWREGIRRMGDTEAVVTVGMRGDGDEPMSEGRNIALLEKIVADQRAIIQEVTGKPAGEVPQIWALYKEVQDYYDHGMRVPDDVTLLFADDNWGNIRRLPPAGVKRTGGYGVYYHFDYVGGPRNYKWMNTNQIERVWEQMQLAYAHGVDRIWIVNVGDIKPMEFPLDFFLDYAWNPDALPVDELAGYSRRWAAEQFGAQHAAEIARLLDTYTKFNARRKPELLSPETYSLLHYREADRVVEAYHQLAREAERLYQQLAPEYRAAFYQLVLYPIVASANINDLYVTVGRNRLYASQGRVSANELAERAEQLFGRDAQLSAFYNDTLAGGKWSHMMDQTRIGYTYWQQPERNVLPEVKRVHPAAAASMGVALEGGAADSLPAFDRFARQHYYIDVFNRGQAAFEFQVRKGADWLRVSPERGSVRSEQRLEVSVDWTRVPSGTASAPLTITGPAGRRVVVQVSVFNPPAADASVPDAFVESGGVVAIEAEHYTGAVATAPYRWVTIPNLGRTRSGVTALPVTRAAALNENSPRLEYSIHLHDGDSVTVHAYLSPTLDFADRKGLRYGISIDDEPPQIVNALSDTSLRAWERSVAGNVHVAQSRHPIRGAGTHVLKFWLIDPGVVLQRLVVDAGGLKPSYLGPPESPRLSARQASAPRAEKSRPVSLAEPLLHSIFQDHLVLQREQPIRVWGRATAGGEVTITLAHARASARADEQGRWQASLPPMRAGGPHTLTARTNAGTQTVSDVLIGDVWLCAGQSNMVLQVARTLDSRSEIANAANKSIRMLTVPLASHPTPQENFGGRVQWEIAAPATVPNWSATCFYFARELQRTQQVPMGMVNAAWGGSNIQTWMSEAALRALPRYAAPLDALRLYTTDQPAAVARWGDVWMQWWDTQRKSQPWTPTALSSEWRAAPPALGFWESWGVPELAQFNGMVWYRADVELTAAQAKQAAVLGIGAVDEVDATWLNGVFIGSTSDPGRRREYAVTAGQLRAGHNVIVVNALDTYATGGMYGPAATRALRLADGTSIPLGAWHYQVADGVDSPPRTPWEATGGLTTIHNAMIAPIAGFTFRGAVWYQGESNTGAAQQYQRLLAAWIADWRSKFSPDLPFLIVQLANYGTPPTAPAESGWADLREAQRNAVRQDGNAALVVTIDIGDRYDIHPANKQEVGRRLARAARRLIYGEPLPPSGPVATGARRAGDFIEVAFGDVTGRLVTYSAAAPIGFELCGQGSNSCRFAPADLGGDRVRLQVPADGPAPTRVRYCWGDSPVCTLFDQAGLPAGPFEVRIQP